MSQRALDDFEKPDEEDRPDEEAIAVAGNGGSAGEVVDPVEAGVPEAQGTVELAVMQVDYTIVGSGDSERPVIHVFGRTPDGELEHVRVLEFEPYFYVPTADIDEEELIAEERITGWEALDGNGKPYESIRGTELTKIKGQTPRDVGQIRDRWDEHYEADILFPNRLLIDKGIQGGLRVPERRRDDGILDVPHQEVESADVSADPRVHTLDIEVDDRYGFPEEGEEEIICLTAHDSYDDEYVVWLYVAPDLHDDAEVPTELPGYEPIEGGDVAVDVRTFEAEDAMLDDYLSYIEETDADLLTGWNFEDFDAPYLLDRLDRLNPKSDYDLSIERLSRIDEVWRSDWGGPDVKGRVVFDLLRGYRSTKFSELESYRLDAVGEMELGVGKERYPGDIGDLWEDDPAQLLEYNLRDVEICVELDRKQKVIAFWQEVASFVGCKMEDAPTAGDAVDMYVLHKAHGEFALPSKGTVEEGEEFEGGAVFEPITGVKEMVSVHDLKSLYPMSMVTINASPETKASPEEFDSEEAFEEQTHRAPNGIRFHEEPDGIIREMVDELLTEREERKGLRNEHEPGSDEYELYDRQQQAVKVIMNSLYGVSGWARFRLYDKDAASAVTATGREVIRFTADVVEEMDHQVTYGDSVTGDRPIVVRNPDGQVQILPIEELFERAIPKPGQAALITADGGPATTVSSSKDRRELGGWEALSLSRDGDPEWQPIEEVIRHETDKPVVKLQHKFGESTTTRDHSYVVEGEDGFVETSPHEVDEPLRIPGIADVNHVETIDIYEVLRGYTREYEDGRSVGNENAETKVKRVHTDERYVWFGHEHHGDIDSTIKVKRFIDVGSEECRSLIRLLAAYITEGSASTAETTDSKFGASIAESRREWLEQLQEDYYRLFENTTAGITKSDSGTERTVEYETDDGESKVTYDDQTLKMQMMNELAAVFFREFAGQTSRGKRIPSFVFHLPENLQDLFLDVLVEGDGSREFPRYSEEYCDRHFDFETTSRDLTAGLSILLTQRGQKHSLKYRDAKDSYTIRTCDYYRKGQPPSLTEVSHDGYVYDLSVAENDNFVDAIGGIVLHNTDSVMLELGGEISKEDAIEQSFEIQNHINGRYDEFAREELNAEFHRFELEFEKLYERFFQAGTKKRYAGKIIWKEGKDVEDVDITGFEYKRSDIAPVTKEVQHRVIEMIVEGEDLEDVKTYLNGVIEEFLEGEYGYEEVGIPGGIGKRLDNYDTDTAQVRGAKYANLVLGTNFQRGSKPKRLYLEKVHPNFFARIEDEEGLDPQHDPVYREFKSDPDVICFEYEDQIPEEFAVDWEKMLDKTLKGPIARILEALDVSWEEVKSGQEQTGLGNFM